MSLLPGTGTRDRRDLYELLARERLGHQKCERAGPLKVGPGDDGRLYVHTRAAAPVSDGEALTLPCPRA
jgi:hypothetical protein